MDWETRYIEKIEQELSELRKHLNAIEHKITDNLDRSMAKLFLVNKERHQEYLNLNQRIDSMGSKVDRAIQWTVKFTIGTLVAVSGLVIALITKIF
ncbi:hypothetical protein IT084_02380 [Desulfallas sp. Bu1-1]|uniref:hypothetical protein n=1 Tax=Desulfallas sp. Bu1-1 TaxID=2787620 RepID=UPI00189E5C56|nr:hypothetical protein [Desulfallas sp. Bu1-1]MBF7081822.1 hypothetical protein [Desulfallas sp. Bu1-1]